MQYAIIDNFLDIDYFNSIKKIVMSDRFAWYFQDGITNPKTGEEIKQEVDAGIAQFEKVMGDIKTGKIDIDTNINNAANQSFDAAKKGFADLNIKTGFEGFDNNTSQVDGFLSNVKASTTDLAKRIEVPPLYVPLGLD